MPLVMWVIFLFSGKKQKTSQVALNNSLYFYNLCFNSNVLFASSN